MDRPTLAAARRALQALHAEVDAASADTARRHRARLACRRGCASCCVDDLHVFEIEADRIREAHPDLLAEGLPAPAGGCAFLDETGACRVYAERPYVCRTQGLPLRWFEERADGEIDEHRDICALNADGPALESLPDEDLWLLGPFEERLAALQHDLDGGLGRRVALRSLFRRQR